MAWEKASNIKTNQTTTKTRSKQETESESQIIQIIKLFALELDNNDLMKQITGIINQSREGAKSSIITGE